MYKSQQRVLRVRSGPEHLQRWGAQRPFRGAWLQPLPWGFSECISHAGSSSASPGGLWRCRFWGPARLSLPESGSAAQWILADSDFRAWSCPRRSYQKQVFNPGSLLFFHYSEMMFIILTTYKCAFFSGIKYIHDVA